MANLKEVKGRIQSIVSTQQITKAMKMVAAAKLRKAQDSIIQMRPFAEKLNSILDNISTTLETADDSPYHKNSGEANILLIVLTSDRGLCGAFNSNMFRKVNQLLQEQYSKQYESGNLTVLPLGKKAYDYYRKRDFRIIEGYQDIFIHLSFDRVKEVAEYIMAAFRKAKFDQVHIIYNEFKNVATQIVRVDQFLPLTTEEDQHNVAAVADYIYQPSKEEILDDLIPQTLKVKLYKAVLESNASEHGARMTAMDKATENAGELLKELRLTYNQTRQAAITKEILEIVAGAEALRSE